MAEGRIKDPDGRQVKPSWGYIQRTDSVSESSPPVNTNWPDIPSASHAFSHPDAPHNCENVR